MVLQHIAASILYCHFSFIYSRPAKNMCTKRKPIEMKGPERRGVAIVPYDQATTPPNELNTRRKWQRPRPSTMFDNTARRRYRMGLFIANPKNEKYIVESVISCYWRLWMIICTTRHICGRSFGGNASHATSRRCENQCARAFRHLSSRSSEELFIRAACLPFRCSKIAEYIAKSTLNTIWIIIFMALLPLLHLCRFFLFYPVYAMAMQKCRKVSTWNMASSMGAVSSINFHWLSFHIFFNFFLICGVM